MPSRRGRNGTGTSLNLAGPSRSARKSGGQKAIIITITGTSGAGKSHLVRQFLSWARSRGQKVAIWDEGHTAPVGYKLLWADDVQHWTYVVGNYEIPTGGCDTFKQVEQVFDLVDERHAAGWDVLYEGLFVMNQTRGPQLAERWPGEIYVLRLDTPLSVCYDAIDERRAQRGAGALTKRDNTRQNYLRAQHYCARMSEAGARIIPVTRTDALQRLTTLFSQQAGR